MKILFIIFFSIGILSIVPQVYGHGIGSETLPPQMIGNYNSTVFLNFFPTTPDESIKKKQISMTIYDVDTGEHLHKMITTLSISKNDKTLFSDDFRIEEGTFTIEFAKKDDKLERQLEQLFESITTSGFSQIQLDEDIFSEGGLYNFDITIQTVDSFDNKLKSPVHFKGALSIPKKFTFDSKLGNQISITTYYDVIESFSLFSDSLEFFMPFDWSKENISQVTVIHEEIHVPKSMSSWISTNYDLRINEISVPDRIITIDDYTIEDERIIHIILPQSFLSDFKNDVNNMRFELKPNRVPEFPLVYPTKNNEYDVSLWWSPENIEWGIPVTFEIRIDDLFVGNKMEKKIPVKVSLMQSDQILFEKTINVIKNTKTNPYSFQHVFDESQEGTVKLLIEDIASNEFADTEFVFTVDAPILKFPITIPSIARDGREGSYDVDMTWIPPDLNPNEESEFIFTIYEKDTKLPVSDAYYEFVLVKDGSEIFRKAGNAPAGGYFEDFKFSENHAGDIIVRLDKIDNSGEYAEISVNVVPEFGLLTLAVLGISVTLLITISKGNFVRKILN